MKRTSAARRLFVLGIWGVLWISISHCSCDPKKPRESVADATAADRRVPPEPGGSCQVHQQCTTAQFCSGGRCLPRCASDGDCATGSHCDPNSKECRPGAAGQATHAKVSRKDFDDVTFYLDAPENDERHVWHEIELPAKTLSWTLAAELTQAPGCRLRLTHIEGPNELGIFPMPEGKSPSIALDPSGPNFSAIQLPHTPAASLVPGKYRARFTFRPPENNDGNKCPNNEYKGRVISLIKTGDAYPTQGTLDLNIYIVGLQGVTSQNAATHEGFQRMFKIFRDSYAKLGLSLGGIKYVPVSQADQDRFAIVKNDAETQALFTLSKGQTNQAVNLFFVRNFQDGFSLGLAGNIPGPSTIHGTKASGVAVAAEELETNPQGVAETIAHELGHYLGLFHLSEMEGTTHDPLPDTPQCTNAQQTDAGPRISAADCRGAGAEYVMFYEPAAGIKQELYSPNQRFVVFLNPAIR